MYFYASFYKSIEDLSKKKGNTTTHIYNISQRSQFIQCSPHVIMHPRMWKN